MDSRCFVGPRLCCEDKEKTGTETGNSSCFLTEFQTLVTCIKTDVTRSQLIKKILISRIPKRKNNCRSRQSIQLQMHLRPPPTPLLMSHVGFAEGL